MAVEGRARQPALAVTAPAPQSPRPGRYFFVRLCLLGLSRNSAPGGREGRRPSAVGRGRGCGRGSRSPVRDLAPALPSVGRKCSSLWG